METDVQAILSLNPQETMQYEKEQNIYSIVKTVEYLEWAYMCGKIKGPEYDCEFKKLLHMFNM